MQRLSLCCTFKESPIRFRTTTVRYISSLPGKGKDPLEYLALIAQENLQSLQEAIDFCSQHEIGSFRINSQFLPIYTHPEWGYELSDLPGSQNLLKTFKKIKSRAEEQNVRLTFHPDQFVVLNSPNEDVVKKSIADLEYHALISELLGADVINIHGGGAYGDKKLALERFAKNFTCLSKQVQSRLTVENDDKIFTPEDLLPLCHQLKIPLVYDVHHHRCQPDKYSVEEATDLALKTWNREPLFHISSPKDGWKGKNPSRHHDFINPKDVPKNWSKINPLTVDIEAKGKEVAVLQLQKTLKKQGWKL